MGRYFAIEGIEGSGKSTQARLLAETLGAVLTRENGGTPLGQEIRKLTHEWTEPIDPLAEAYLFAADRAQVVSEVVVPSLDGGRSVVTDRSVFSSLAYQGVARGLGMSEVWRINGAIRPLPHVVVYVWVPLDVSLRRIESKSPDRIESEPAQFFMKVADAFEEMFRASYGAAAWVKIDGTKSVDEVHADIMLALRKRSLL